MYHLISVFSTLLLICSQTVNPVAVKQTQQQKTQHRQKPVQISKHPVTLVISFDGFWVNYLSPERTPTLNRLRQEGVWVPYMEPRFPSKTLVNHHSMSTGLVPDCHGLVDNTVFDPVYNDVLRGKKDDPRFWHFHQDIYPFWIRNELAGEGRYSGTFMWPGSTQGWGPKQNLKATYHMPKYDESIPWEQRVKSVIDWLTNPQKPANMVFLYFNEPDTHGHKYGAEGKETLAEVKLADQKIAGLIEKLKRLGIYEKINLMIVSDHGMSTISKQRVIRTKTLVKNHNLFDIYGGSPIYHLRAKNKKDVNVIYNSFKRVAKSNHFQVLRKSELPGKFENFYGTNRRIGDIVLLSYPGYVFDFDYGEDIFKWAPNGLAGEHGFDNKDPSMRAMFIARGPNFKKHFKLTQPIKNIDLVPLWSKIVGIHEPPNNGSSKIIVKVLQHWTVPISGSDKPHAKNSKTGRPGAKKRSQRGTR